MPGRCVEVSALAPLKSGIVQKRQYDASRRDFELGVAETVVNINLVGSDGQLTLLRRRFIIPGGSLQRGEIEAHPSQSSIATV